MDTIKTMANASRLVADNKGLKNKIVNIVFNGLFAGVVAVLLTSRIGSTRPNIAHGWELEAITLVVLGGVSISGGKGNKLRIQRKV